ncbi:MAG: hypothetical protein Q8M24_22990 [Pseudolabrys sp.]|nr:hypothetical protein [Pseudolabrys sp.]MDP2298319.1 hypothetical protein [Pseudolabrys sp.]
MDIDTHNELDAKSYETKSGIPLDAVVRTQTGSVDTRRAVVSGDGALRRACGDRVLAP